MSREEIGKKNEKQVHTMAAGKKIAHGYIAVGYLLFLQEQIAFQGIDWHISLLKKLCVEPEDREVPERSSNVSFIAVSHVRGKDG